MTSALWDKLTQTSVYKTVNAANNATVYKLAYDPDIALNFKAPGMLNSK